jgi:hypothetical protein
LRVADLTLFGDAHTIVAIAVNVASTDFNALSKGTFQTLGTIVSRCHIVMLTATPSDILVTRIRRTISQKAAIEVFSVTDPRLTDALTTDALKLTVGTTTVGK